MLHINFSNNLGWISPICPSRSALHPSPLPCSPPALCPRRLTYLDYINSSFALWLDFQLRLANRDRELDRKRKTNRDIYFPSSLDVRLLQAAQVPPPKGVWLCYSNSVFRFALTFRLRGGDIPPVVARGTVLPLGFSYILFIFVYNSFIKF